jgi:hypothetical protein
MTKIAIVPNAAGTGTFTIEAPNSNSNRTLTLPDAAGEIYGQGNILGTVSQSAGVPTGAIIERGSNANGSFVKYADGTMICHGALNLTGSTVDTGQSSGTITTAASFASATDTNFDISLGADNVAQFITNKYMSAASSGSWVLRNQSGATRTYQIVAYAAIGRWF